MIESKLILIEQATINNPTKNPLKLNAIRETKKLLTQIDFNAEIVPMECSIKLKELLTFLKGTLLTKEESKLAEELVE
tara:strand:+ start:16 stop:249 length:234 start_codon:yes stop_codon:yes gene_type:complete